MRGSCGAVYSGGLPGVRRSGDVTPRTPDGQTGPGAVHRVAVLRLRPASSRRQALDPSRAAASTHRGRTASTPRRRRGTRHEVTGPPDFVGIGAQKAGTTWWFDAICAHPEVYARARHPQGASLLRPLRRPRIRGGGVLLVPRLVPPSLRLADRRVDPGLHPMCLGSAAARPSGSADPHPGPPARPCRAIPLGARPPAPRSGQTHRRINAGRARLEGSITMHSPMDRAVPGPNRSSSCSTSNAGPIRGPAQSDVPLPRARTRRRRGFAGPGEPDHEHVRSQRRRSSATGGDLRIGCTPRLLEQFPWLDVGLWPNFVSLAR